MVRVARYRVGIPAFMHPAICRRQPKMGDDTCRPHEHYGRPCYRHHFTPRDTIMYCPFCSRRADSVRGDNVARKHQDRYGDW